MLGDYMMMVFSGYVDGVLKFAGEMLGIDDKSSPDQPSGRSFPALFPFGFVSRPRDPDTDPVTGAPTNGAGLVVEYHGHDGHATPGPDPRALEKTPQIKKGGTALYSHPGGLLVIDGDDGSILILVPDGNGSNHFIAVDAKNKNIEIRHTKGMGISLAEGGKNSVVIENSKGDAYVEVNDDGINLNGNVKINGAVVAGDPASGRPVTMSSELQALIALLSSTGLAVSGAKATLVGVEPTTFAPGSSSLKASP